MCVVIANAQADYQRDLALFGKVRMHCVSLHPGDGLVILVKLSLPKRLLCNALLPPCR